MLEPFGFSRLWMLKKLDRKGTFFGLQRTLTRPESPFWRAVSSYIHVNESNIRTYVIREETDEGWKSGVVQIRECLERPEAEVIYVAPSLSAYPGARALWTKLLAQVCKRAGEQGLLRLFATVPWDEDEADVFRQAGFVTYAKEEILRLDELGPVQRKFPLNGVRPLTYGDESRLLELYARVTPRHIQWAEGQNLPHSWGDLSYRRVPRDSEAYVLEEGRGETIAGFLHIFPGKTGHWLEMTILPDSDADVDDLLIFGLERISAWPSRPIYTAVREYLGGVLPALYSRGFEPCAQQAAMVKNTAVWLKDPFQSMIPVVKKRVGPSTPTVTLLNGEAMADSPSQPVAAIVGSSHE